VGNSSDVLDVAIIGAGPAGIGVGLVLQQLGINNFAILERDCIGASFERWPIEMRFISPSFNSNPFGLLDLNAIVLQTSPAYSYETEHLSGAQYAAYLRGVAEHWQLPIEIGIEVRDIVAQESGSSTAFRITTNKKELTSRFIIWAAGEFQTPKLNPFAGAALCIHNSHIQTWASLKGKEFIVIGGYESGIDAAINLTQRGKRVRVLDGQGKWEYDDADPSISLSPYTKSRLREALQTGRIELIKDARVQRVEKNGARWVICTEAGEWLESNTQPILASGFHSSASLLPQLWAFRDDGMPELTAHDESTVTPGLFLCGPSVRHGKHIFCYIYKFRQRFAVVANQIAQRLGLNTLPLEELRRNNLYLDDLSCCDDACAAC
jgi:thioredoxin reductase